MILALKKIILTTTIIGSSVTSFAQSQQNSSNASGKNDTWNSFLEMRRKYRQGEINDAGIWRQLVEINASIGTLPPVQQATILQTQAAVLKSSGFPILAAINAAQSLRKAPDPLDDDYKRNWTILKEVSQQYPINLTFVGS
jgi:hypothetical protein